MSDIVFEDFEAIVMSYNESYWNWTTIPDFLLEPEQDGKYHITYSFMTTQNDAAHYNVAGISVLDLSLQNELYDKFSVISMDLQTTISAILNPTETYSALFSDVTNITFSTATSGRGMIDFGATVSAGEGGLSAPGTLDGRDASFWSTLALIVIF